MRGRTVPADAVQEEKRSGVSPLKIPIQPGNGRLQACDCQASHNKYEAGGRS